MTKPKRIWIDVLTPKQARLFAYIAKWLKSQGFEVLVTTRSYDYTLGTLHRIGIESIVIGGYGYSLKQKLEEEFKRGLELLKIINEFDVLIAYPNPLAARIAFGLAKKYIAITDSPHSIAPSKLSLPLASTIIIPECIPRHEIERYVYYKDNVEIITYRGVDEVLWIKNSSPSREALSELDLQEREYIVIRPPEIRASYYSPSWFSVEDLLKTIDKALARDLRVVYMPRYDDDPIIKKYRDTRYFIVPEQRLGIDTISLEYYSLGVITGGATMAREAALLGIPSVSTYRSRLYVNDYIRRLGFPLFYATSFLKALEIILDEAKYIDIYIEYSRNVVNKLETVVDALKRSRNLFSV